MHTLTQTMPDNEEEEVSILNTQCWWTKYKQVCSLMNVHGNWNRKLSVNKLKVHDEETNWTQSWQQQSQLQY